MWSICYYWTLDMHPIFLGLVNLNTCLYFRLCFLVRYDVSLSLTFQPLGGALLRIRFSFLFLVWCQNLLLFRFCLLLFFFFFFFIYYSQDILSYIFFVLTFEIYFFLYTYVRIISLFYRAWAFKKTNFNNKNIKFKKNFKDIFPYRMIDWKSVTCDF